MRTHKFLDAIEPSPELLQVQSLMPISQVDRDALKADIQKHGIKDGLKVYHEKGRHFILSGLNRWQIAKELGLESVPIDVIDIPKRKRKAYCIDDNLSRRHLTTLQKRTLVDYLLNETPLVSSRSIAKKVGVDKNTVESRRQKSGGEIHHLKRKGADGKTYTKQPATKTHIHINKKAGRAYVFDAKEQKEKLRSAFASAIHKHGEGLSMTELRKELKSASQMVKS